MKRHARKSRRKTGRIRQSGFYNDIENYTGYIDYWDEWNDWRDGMRGSPDKTKLRSEESYHSEYWEIPKWNSKIKKHISKRNAMKHGRIACVIY